MSLRLIIYFIFSTSRKFPFQDRQLQCLDTDFSVGKNLLYFISCRCTEEAHKFLIANRKMSFEKSIILLCKVVGIAISATLFAWFKFSVPFHCGRFSHCCYCKKERKEKEVWPGTEWWRMLSGLNGHTVHVFYKLPQAGTHKFIK